MKALQLNDYGAPYKLRFVDIPKPTPGPNEVLIKVGYAGLRMGDVMSFSGDPVRRFEPPFEWTPGQEVTGVIEAVGSDVRDLKVGDRVFGNTGGGAYAEYATCAAARCQKIPDRAKLSQAIAYPVNMRTAWFCVYPWGKIQEGENVLVHTAAGGVGRMIVQLLKRRFKNVNVIGLASSDEKLAIIKSDGADHAINYKTQDYVAEVERITGPKPRGFSVGVDGGGVQVSLNGVRGPTLKTDPLIIAKRGRWVLYGHTGDRRTAIDATSGGRDAIDTMPFTYDGITIMPFSNMAWYGQPEQEEARAFTDEWMRTEPLIEAYVRDFDDAIQGIDDYVEGKTNGKFAFKIAGEL
jgi:NADPH2:quinone reductase